MTPLLRLAAGAGAGIVGMSATYPLDMVRGRLTVQSMEGVHRYRGIMHATAVIVKEASSLSLTLTLTSSSSFTCLALGCVSTAHCCSFLHVQCLFMSLSVSAVSLLHSSD